MRFGCDYEKLITKYKTISNITKFFSPMKESIPVKPSTCGTISHKLALMSNDLIEFILYKIDQGKINKRKLALSLGKSPSFFVDFKSRKTITIDDLINLSMAMNYNFFDHITVPGFEKKEHPVESKPPKKAKVSVVIEIENESEERKVLESILDRNSVKKLLG